MKKRSIIILVIMLGVTFGLALKFGGVTGIGTTIGSLFAGFDGGANTNSPSFPGFNGLTSYSSDSRLFLAFDRDLQAQVLADSYPLIDGGLGVRTRTFEHLITGNFFDFESGVNSSTQATTSDFSISYSGSGTGL